MFPASLLATLILFFASGIALAHPGHGITEPDSPAHYVFEPMHMIWWLAPTLLVVAAVFYFRKNQNSR